MPKQRRPTKGRGKTAGRYAKRRRIPWLILGGAGVIVLAAFLLARAVEVGAPGERIAVSGVGQHVAEGQPVQYNANPPVGGPHWPSPAGWGASTTTIPDERAVHNLEHGGIVIDYNGISADDLAKIKSLLLTYPRDRYNEVKLVIQPYPNIAPGTIALTAWGWRQILTAYDDQTVRAFLDAHMNRCCESVP